MIKFLCEASVGSNTLLKICIYQALVYLNSVLNCCAQCCSEEACWGFRFLTGSHLVRDYSSNLFKRLYYLEVGDFARKYELCSELL